ncbi:uncharacterized protein FIBRA_08641 [Fibroporia radiculosa]|uniref:DNA 3'-5' helicase n=1 Tax=Fibroporia radiculosa TaxID=599839 RepID=J4I339_9APHY|nr:uncharacterized protein FIBRA_08641 [Fibroporia radiculosa]CCM06382.1 predicted protein [Fibroporia radiculosa]
MSGPRNNLEDLRLRRVNGATAPQSPANRNVHDQQKASKFKPSTSFNTPEQVTNRKLKNPLPSFSTPGFGKSKPLPLHSTFPADNTIVVDVSSAESSPTGPSVTRVPAKRLSSDFPVDFEMIGSAKRVKIDEKLDKENVFASSPKDKGKDKDHPPTLGTRGNAGIRLDHLSYETQKDSILTSPLNIVQSYPLNWSDLLLKSEDELNMALNSNITRRNEISEWIRQASSGPNSGHDVGMLLDFDKILEYRIKIIMAIRTSLSKGERPIIPDPAWLPTPPSHNPYSVKPRSSLYFSAQEPVKTSTEVVASTSRSKVVYDDTNDYPRAMSLPDDGSMQMVAAHGATAKGPSLPVPRSVTLSLSPEPAVVHNSNLTKSIYYPEVLDKLQRCFGLTSFRKNQLETIIATMTGRDTLVLMPTGGGKSLCYQLPAICTSGVTRGVTVVISPLLALMQDQVEQLNRKGIDVLYFNSDQDREESARVASHLRAYGTGNKPLIVYATPEKLQHSGEFLSILKGLYSKGLLARFPIDEAHCIVKWGRDFREAYKLLGRLRDEFPKIPIMALTATATEQVKTDIIRLLKIKDCEILWQSMNRQNLFYEIRSKKGYIKDMVDFIVTQHSNETGIIYCQSRKSCEELAKTLRDQYRLDALHYHAGMISADRKDVQARWQTGRCKIIVATVAFGMGVDKPDVRFVIHRDLPNDLDGYYQETGRAGRDGKPADCLLYYSYGDAISRRRQIRDNRDTNHQEKSHQEEELQRVVQYCQNDVDCRRTQVLAYYSEQFDHRKCHLGCDNCSNPQGVERHDVTTLAVQFIQFAQAIVAGGERVTRNQFLDAVRGSTNKAIKDKNLHQHPHFACGKGTSRECAERLVDRLDAMGIFDSVTVQNGEWGSSYLRVTAKGDHFISRGERLTIEMRAGTSKRPTTNALQRSKRPSSNVTTAAKSANKPPQIPDDPIVSSGDDEEDFWQSDDDIQFVPSPKKVAARRPLPVMDEEFEIEFSDKSDDANLRAHKRELERLRQQIADEVGELNPEEIVDSGLLEYLSLVDIADLNDFNKALIEFEVDPQGPFKLYSMRFLDCCVKKHVHRRGSKATKAKSAASIGELHDKFDYQRTKPPSTKRPGR